MSETTKKPKPFYRRSFLLLALPFLAVAGLLAPRAFANGWGKKGHCRHMKNATPEQIRERIDGRVDHMLDFIDATDEQRASLTGIIDGALPEMMQMRQEKEKLHQRMHGLVTADELDRESLNHVRADAIALADKASKRGVDIVVEVRDILDAEQRAKLLKMFRRFHD